jgi:hypothetical protein
MDESPKPALVQVFEAIAGVLDINHGQTRLELEFDDGHLRRWWAHDERNGALQLHEFDAQAAWLVPAELT